MRRSFSFEVGKKKGTITSAMKSPVRSYLRLANDDLGGALARKAANWPVDDKYDVQ